MKNKLPSRPKEWATFIIRVIFEIGIAWNLYKILPDTIRWVSALTSPTVQSYIVPVTLVVIVSYIAWRVFSPKWSRDDIVSITVGYVILSIPFVYLHDAIFQHNWVRLGVSVVIFVLGVFIADSKDADYVDWTKGANMPAWAIRIVELVCKLWLNFSIVAIAWKVVNGLQYVGYIPIFSYRLPPLNISGIQGFYQPIMLALSLAVVYYTVNGEDWFKNAKVVKIVVVIILSMAASIVLTIPDAIVTAAVVSVLSAVLIVAVCIVGLIIVGAALAASA